jgi:hypothetical protein
MGAMIGSPLYSLARKCWRIRTEPAKPLLGGTWRGSIRYKKPRHERRGLKVGGSTRIVQLHDLKVSMAFLGPVGPRLTRPAESAV